MSDLEVWHSKKRLLFLQLCCSLFRAEKRLIAQLCHSDLRSLGWHWTYSTSISFFIYRTKVEASTPKRAVIHELLSCFVMPNPEEVAPSQMAGNNIQYLLAVPWVLSPLPTCPYHWQEQELSLGQNPTPVTKSGPTPRGSAYTCIRKTQSLDRLA